MPACRCRTVTSSLLTAPLGLDCTECRVSGSGQSGAARRLADSRSRVDRTYRYRLASPATADPRQHTARSRRCSWPRRTAGSLRSPARWMRGCLVWQDVDRRAMVPFSGMSPWSERELDPSRPRITRIRDVICIDANIMDQMPGFRSVSHGSGINLSEAGISILCMTTTAEIRPDSPACSRRVVLFSRKWVHTASGRPHSVMRSRATRASLHCRSLICVDVKHREGDRPRGDR